MIITIILMIMIMIMIQNTFAESAPLRAAEVKVIQEDFGIIVRYC